MMKKQLASEIRKALTHNSWWLLGVVLAVFSAGLASVYLFAGLNMPKSPLDFSQTDHLQSVYGVAAIQAYVFAGIAGAMAMTGEYQSKTIGLTLLANPRRVQVFGSKIVTSAATGLVHGIIALAATVAVAVAMLRGQGLDPMLTNPEILSGLAGSAVCLAVWAVIGVALGTIIRNQLGAVVGLLVFVFLVEPGLDLLLPQEAVPYLPSHLADAAAGGTFLGSPGIEPLAPGLALGILAVLAAALCALGAYRFRRLQVS